MPSPSPAGSPPVPTLLPLPRTFATDEEVIAWAGTPEGQAFFAALSENLTKARVAGQVGQVVEVKGDGAGAASGTNKTLETLENLENPKESTS